MIRFVLASNNSKKLIELRELLSDMDIDVISQQEAGCTFQVEETGESFEENACLKAKAVTDATGMPAIAEDSGLVVDALGGAPGIYSARFGGESCKTDADRIALLLEKMKKAELRSARFVSCIVCTFPNGDVLRARGECEGEILTVPRGENGFGYDPVFRPLGHDKSMAEMSLAEKNSISHRGKSLAEFKKLLSDYLKNKPAKSDKGGDETSKEKQDMSLTSKQRAQLMSMASKEDTIVHIGKGGINENVIKQVEDALKARELIKGTVLENSPISAREACDRLAEICKAEPVKVIGRKFVLYKRNDKEPKIVLTEGGRK